MAFTDDVLTTCGEILNAAQFYSSNDVFSSNEQVVFTKFDSESLAYYLFFQDDRKTGGNVSVTLWFAPIQIPDDRINVLGIGIKCELLSVFDLADEVVRGVAEKAIALAEELVQLRPFVMRELTQPFVRNRRVNIFKTATCIYEAAVSDSDTADALGTLGNRFVAKDLDLDAIRDECAKLLTEISNSDVRLPSGTNKMQQARLLAEMTIAHVILKCR